MTVVDTWKLYAGPDNNAPADLFPDLLHPNNLGYAKWAAALRPVLATQGFLDRDNDEFTIENDLVPLFNGHDLTGWGYRLRHVRSPKIAEHPAVAVRRSQSARTIRS